MNRFGIRKILALALALLVFLGSAQAMSLIDALGQLAQPDQPAAQVNVDPADDWWNILLMGVDSYRGNEYDRSDSMIILSINRSTSEIKLTSLMRDTWVHVSGRKSGMKLTEACVYGGPEMTMRAINENFGMELTDYALVSMQGMAEIIDMAGGLELDITEAERKAINKGLFDLSSASGMEKLEQSGEGVHLNGNQATAYARIRNIDSDFVRTGRQRIVLTTLAKKIVYESNAMEILGLATALLDYVETSLSFSEIMTIAEIGFKADLSNIQELRLPADGTFNSGTYDGVWCIKPNFEKNADLLREFIYGPAE